MHYKQGSFVTGVLSAASAASVDWNDDNGDRPPTILYLPAEFQLQICCISWDIVKNVIYNYSVSHPTTQLAQFDTADSAAPRNRLETDSQWVVDRYPAKILFSIYAIISVIQELEKITQGQQQSKQSIKCIIRHPNCGLQPSLSCIFFEISPYCL